MAGNHRKQWSPEEEQLLRGLFECGTSVEQIAGVLNRKPHSVSSKASKLGGLSPVRNWTATEESILRTRYAANIPASMIAEEVGRPLWGVYLKASRLGLGEAGRQQRRQGWRNRGGKQRTVAGRRADIKLFVRSAWEANVARVLNRLTALGEVSRWYYEPRRFSFPGIERGIRSYLPDFLVKYRDGRYEWWEVKGYMDKDSKTRLKRFAKFYPDERLVVIDLKAYKELEREHAPLIREWER